MYATASRWKRTGVRLRSNISRSDPSGTIGIQRSYIADLNRRWKKVARAIQDLVVADDALRLGPAKPSPFLPVAASLATNIQHGVPFVFRQDVAGKTEDFNTWLNQQLDSDVLEVRRGAGGRVMRNSKWQDRYVRSSYGRGLKHAEASMKSAGISFDSRTAADLFNAPIHVDTLALMYTRQFSDLQGITQATSTQISRVLTEGIATGKGPREMARTMRTAISNIGVNRARTLARTEVIRVHAESTLNRYKDAGLQKVNVLAEFATGKDDRVCPICIGLETGEALSLDEARGMIPVHANCRCVWLPVTSAPALPPLQKPATPWRQTADVHKRADGTWTPERARLHQKLVDNHFARIPHATKAGKYVKGTVRPVSKPTAEILGGGPSAGKGTAVMKNTKFTRNRVHIDPDEIKAMLPEYGQAVARGSAQAASIVHTESSYISQLIADRAAKGKYNFLMDGTGDGSFEKLIERLSTYRAGGARVSAHYVTIDTEAAVARSAVRGAETGRFVPDEYIRQVHGRLSSVVPRALNEGHFDDFVLWDNNGKAAFRVAQVADGKLEILDPKAWKRFLDKAPGATPVPVPVPVRTPFVPATSTAEAEAWAKARFVPDDLPDRLKAGRNFDYSKTDLYTANTINRLMAEAVDTKAIYGYNRARVGAKSMTAEMSVHQGSTLEIRRGQGQARARKMWQHAKDMKDDFLASFKLPKEQFLEGMVHHEVAHMIDNKLTMIAMGAPQSTVVGATKPWLDRAVHVRAARLKRRWAKLYKEASQVPLMPDLPSRYAKVAGRGEGFAEVYSLYRMDRGKLSKQFSEFFDDLLEYLGGVE